MLGWVFHKLTSIKDEECNTGDKRCRESPVLSPKYKRVHMDSGFDWSKSMALDKHLLGAKYHEERL